MALAAEVQSRYPSALLIQLTNPMNTAASSVNMTTLGLAATDVEADFQITAGVAYDGADARHVSVGIEGVIAKLLERTGHSDASAWRARYDSRLRDLAKVTGRDRILPTSDGILQPTEPQAGTIVRPAFDDDVFDGFVPGAPT